MIDILGHIGYIFFLIGAILLAQKKLLGWIFAFAGQIIWIVIGVSIGMSSIWIWGIVFAVINIFGFFKWRKNNVENRHENID